ncbi:alpha/beta fold hydrolase [Paraburkholderia flava]|uniref:alpha/beta fold hydrolase n=1 Tax=Paraburkholderia flava TaxID=2547393 RepID=UPI00105BF308|nr:alpha/beta hydrolase [Paraburkholderia flava]
MTHSSETNNSSIHSIRTGPRGGTPVVLVHPVGLDLTYWDNQIEALCDGYDVIAYDLPGHGRSAGRPEDWTLDQAAVGLAEVVSGSAVTSVHLVGLSVGGMISQKLAMTRPEQVASLTLIDTAASFAEAAREAMRLRAQSARSSGMHAVLQTTLERWFTGQTRARRPDLIDRVARTLLADDPAIHGAMWDMIAELDLVDGLNRIACPTLILVGEFDPSSPPSAARQLHDRIPDSRLHIIEQASHMAPLERPEVINTHLLSFLDSR